MSFICDSINPFRSKPKPNNPQENQLNNNPNNNIIPYRNNNLSQSMRVSGNNHLDQINSGNNLGGSCKSTSIIIAASLLSFFAASRPAYIPASLPKFLENDTYNTLESFSANFLIANNFKSGS